LADTGLGQNVSGTRYVAGGGGGAVERTYGSPGGGGAGGGGSGTLGGGAATSASTGVANTGGGGGGWTAYGGTQFSYFNGGSGLAIIRYSDSYAAASATTGSPTITITNGYRYYAFTSSGSITF